jgi:predicted P-loop ATPase
MSHITMIQASRPASLGKRFELDELGVMRKSVVANVSAGKAIALCIERPEDLCYVLTRICEAKNIALMPGRLVGAKGNAPVQLVTEKKLGKLLKCNSTEVPGGVQEVDGEKYAARLKRGIEPSAWILIDADDPRGIPPEWAAMSLQERLELLEPLVPGISTCARVEYRSSSARVVKNDQEPRGATHAWIKISDPAKTETLREHVKVQMQLQGLSFPSPRHSKEPRQVIGHEARTVVDLAVWVPGRLVFCSKPEVVNENYYVTDADIKIVNPDCGTLDVSAIELPSDGDLEKLQGQTGRSLSFSQNNGLKVSDTGTLTLDTLIESKGVFKPFSEVVADMNPGEKVRCETPFRDSSSEAAFIRLKDDGVPFLYDIGSSTSFYLAPGHEIRLREQGAELNQTTGPSGTCGEGLKMPVANLLDDPNRIVRRGKNPIANHANAMTIIRDAAEWDGVLVFNDLSEDLMLLKPIPGSRSPKYSFKPRPIQDNDFICAVAWFNRHGFPSMGKDKVIDAVETVAKEGVISPVRNYLERVSGSIKWHPSTNDAKLPRLFQDYFGAEGDAGMPGADPKYLSAVGRKFMVSAVARALRPGCKVDTMLVLEGEQGAGKSSAARILAGSEYFSDNLPAMGTKDASDHVRGKWVVEIGELSAMQKSEIEVTKAFISRQQEKFRPAYNRKEITYKRRCVFIGTTNQDTYLRDETGNRRFWPVKVGKINLAALQQDRDLLWAEAVYWYETGVKWYLSADEEALAKEVQTDRVSVDVWQDELLQLLKGKSEISIAEAARLLDLTRDKINRADQNRIVACLKGLGFVREGKFTSGQYRNAARYVLRKN